MLHTAMLAEYSGDGTVGLSVGRGLAKNFHTDIHDSQMIYPNDFSDPMTFHLAPP